jgi:hypothetical protein
VNLKKLIPPAHSVLGRTIEGVAGHLWKMLSGESFSRLIGVFQPLESPPIVCLSQMLQRFARNNIDVRSIVVFEPNTAAAV